MDLQHLSIPELHCSVSFPCRLLVAAYLTRPSPSLNSNNQSILASPYAFVANQQNYQCSVEIYASQLAKFPVGDGYTILFSDTLNSSNVSSYIYSIVHRFN